MIFKCAKCGERYTADRVMEYATICASVCPHCLYTNLKQKKNKKIFTLKCKHCGKEVGIRSNDIKLAIPTNDTIYFKCPKCKKENWRILW